MTLAITVYYLKPPLSYSHQKSVDYPSFEEARDMYHATLKKLRGEGTLALVCMREKRGEEWALLSDEFSGQK